MKYRTLIRQENTTGEVLINGYAHKVLEKCLSNRPLAELKNKSFSELLQETPWQTEPVFNPPLLTETYYYHFNGWIDECIFEDPLMDAHLIRPLIHHISDGNFLILTIPLGRWSDSQLAVFIDSLQRGLLEYRLRFFNRRLKIQSTLFSIQFHGQATFDRLQLVSKLLTPLTNTLVTDFKRVTMPSKQQERKKKQLEKQLNTIFYQNGLSTPDIEAQITHRIKILEASLPTIEELLTYAPGIGPLGNQESAYWEPKTDSRYVSQNMMGHFGAWGSSCGDYLNDYGYFRHLVGFWTGHRLWDQVINKKNLNELHNNPLLKPIAAFGYDFAKVYEYISRATPRAEDFAAFHQQYDLSLGDLNFKHREQLFKQDNLLAVLQLPPDTTDLNTIKERYTELTRRYHPDSMKRKTDTDTTAEFQLIQNTYHRIHAVLSKNFILVGTQEDSDMEKMKFFREQYPTILTTWTAMQTKKEDAIQLVLSGQRPVDKWSKYSFEAPLVEHLVSNSPRSSRSASLLSMTVNDFLVELKRNVLDPIIQEERRLQAKKKQRTKSKIQLSQIIELKVAIESSLEQAQESAKHVGDATTDKRRFYLETGTQLDTVLGDFLNREKIATQPNLIRRFLKRLALGLKRVMGVALAIPALGLPLLFRSYRKQFFLPNNEPTPFEKLTQQLQQSVVDHTSTEEKRMKPVLTTFINDIDQFYKIDPTFNQQNALHVLLQQLGLPYPKAMSDWHTIRNKIISHLSSTTGSFGWLGRHRLHAAQPYLEILYLEWLRALCTEANKNLDAGQSIKEALFDVTDWQTVLHELITLQEAFDLGGRKPFGKLVQKIHMDLVKVAHEHKSKTWLRVLWGELPSNHFASQVDQVFTEYDAILARHLTTYRELLGGFCNGFGSDARRSEALALLQQLASQIDMQYDLLRGELATLHHSDQTALDVLKQRLENTAVATENTIQETSGKLYMILNKTSSAAGCYLAMPAKTELPNEKVNSYGSNGLKFFQPSEQFTVGYPHNFRPRRK